MALLPLGGSRKVTELVSSSSNRKFTREREKIIEEVKPQGKKILDVGTGKGRFAIDFVKNGGQVPRIRHKDWRTGRHEFERCGALIGARHKKILSLIRVNLRHSRTVLFFALFAVACSKSPTDSKGISLTGSVRLEGQSDHSGTVADFGLRILDFGLQMGRDVKNRQGWSRMVKEFHTVGIPISQATEFDHRLAKPIYQTQTKADGSYKIEGIEEGAYNLVAVRQGYGWKYLYEAEVAKEAKTVAAENIVLYPEMEVSGMLNQYTVWPSGHHIIAKGDVTLPRGEILVIDRGAVIRFDGFYELRIEGNLHVNVEQMNWCGWDGSVKNGR